MKAYLLGNYTQDLIASELKNTLTTSNNQIDFFVGGFNQYRQEIINTESSLYSLNPDVVFVSLDFFTLIEDIIYSIESNESFGDLILDRLKESIELIKILGHRLPNTQIFSDNFLLFRPILMGTLEYNSKVSVSEYVIFANNLLYRELKSISNIKIVDIESLVIHHGAIKLFDERMYYIAKCHWSFSGIQELTKLYTRYLNAFLGVRKKCLVLDLDNTLWGGIIGDDGVENIKLSNDGPGKAYFDFQREILKLHDRGVLLAVCSKNSYSNAIEAIDNHPNMILRKNHFLVLKINWNNKAQNIQEIAQELNIGLDSLVFLDDSPFEREIVSTKLPDVLVPELPSEASEYPNFIRNLSVFNFLTLSKDDYSRNQTYKANISRDNLKQKVIKIEDFYFSLEMKADINKITDFQVARISQMTQKTNQFNLRTMRYNEMDIKRFVESKKHEVYSISISDKFGDSGIIGCAITEYRKGNVFIDTFILSCRALGRTVETALLNYIIEDIDNNKFPVLCGEYIQTNKNSPCSSFYADHKFAYDNERNWCINLKAYTKKRIPWINIK